jgi:hypothetical protein
MAVRLGGSAIREIRTLLDWGAMGSWTDWQLLAHLPGGGEERAIQVFERYPDRPTRLEPGKRIGFDVSVADRDTP